MPVWAEAVRSAGPVQEVAGISTAILWLAAGYLILLGLTVIFRPVAARRFLGAFAQTTKANLIEAGFRLLVGLAFVGAASRTRDPTVSIALGLFLAATALLLALLPGPHRRFAARTLPFLLGWFPLFGLTSLILAAGLLWFVT